MLFALAGQLICGEAAKSQPVETDVLKQRQQKQQRNRTVSFVHVLLSRELTSQFYLLDARAKQNILERKYLCSTIVFLDLVVYVLCVALVIINFDFISWLPSLTKSTWKMAWQPVNVMQHHMLPSDLTIVLKNWKRDTNFDPKCQFAKQNLIDFNGMQCYTSSAPLSFRLLFNQVLSSCLSSIQFAVFRRINKKKKKMSQQPQLR